MSGETKVCSKCKETKNVSEFNKDKSKKDELTSSCKKCHKDWNKNNKEKIAKTTKAYYKKNKEKLINYRKNYYKLHKEKCLKQIKAHYKANKEKIIKHKGNYVRKKRKLDPFFRIQSTYRVLVYRAFKYAQQKKNTPSLKLLGCTWQEFLKHLSDQFYDHPETGKKMTFDNNGVHGWHQDHIIPLKTAKTEEDIIKLCHYTNLQPLWAEENRRKGSKVLDNIE